MKEDLTQKLQNILGTLDKDKLLKGKKEVESFLSTAEGKKLVANLKNEDKEKILEKFMKMDSGDLKRKLNTDGLKNLSGLKAEDIFRKLR